MLEQLLIAQPVAAVAACLAIYIADYFFTIFEARLYQDGAKAHLAFEGRYGSSSIFHLEDSVLRWWNPRYLWVLAILIVGVSVTWYLLVRRYALPEVFAFLLGGLILMEAAVVIRQVRRVILFAYIKNGRGVRGELEVSRRLSAIMWFNELYAYTGLYAFSFLLTGSWIFLGGAVTCFIASRRQRDWAVMLPEPFSGRTGTSRLSSEK